MAVRPLEPEDAPAVLALLDEPDVAAWADDRAWQKRLETPSGEPGAQRLGVWAGDRLAGAVSLDGMRHARAAHVASIALLGDAGPALDAMIDAADRWLQIARLEAVLDVDDPAARTLATRGFLVEARKEKGLWPRDALVLGRLRPGVVSSPRPPPSWPVRGRPLGEVAFRAVAPDDGPAFAAVMRDPTVVWGTMQIPTVSGERWRRTFAGNGPEHRVLVVTVDGVAAGNFGLHRHPPPHEDVATIGMSVASAYQGSGLGGRIMTEIVRLAGEMGLGRVELEVYPDNTRAVALYERFGFVREGVRRAAVYRDGGFVDSAMMARMAP